MMKFLYLTTALFFSCTVMAQDSGNTLFPELNRREAADTEIPAQPKSVMDNTSAAPTASVPQQVAETNDTRKAVPSLFDKPADIQRQEEEERIRSVINKTMGLPEDNTTIPVQNEGTQGGIEKPSKAEDGFFVFSPSDIKIVVPTIAKFQYCMSQLSLTNYTDAELRELSVVLKYRDIEIPYKYKGLQIGGRQSGKVALGGEACQSLKTGPGITVKKCVAVRKVETDTGVKEVPLSEAECRGKVKYVQK